MSKKAKIPKKIKKFSKKNQKSFKKFIAKKSDCFRPKKSSFRNGKNSTKQKRFRTRLSVSEKSAFSQRGTNGNWFGCRCVLLLRESSHTSQI